jgi:Tfp pilus assembly protein PilX
MGRKPQRRSKGFTLVAALLLLLLLSGVAVGLMYMVNGESRMGGSDMNYNIAYYAAESGMEKLTADLAGLYESAQTPTTNSVTNLANFPPTTLGSMNFTETVTWTPSNPADPTSPPVTNWNTISSGSNQGLKALIIPYTLNVNATQPGSNVSANITRNVEVALIPVFQFGIFAEGDIDYFAGPAFTFKGRVHTNGNLYLASGSTLALFDKATAFGNIVTDRLENGHLTSSGYTGTIYIPNASGGCDVTQPATHCLASSSSNPASWSGGIPTGAGSQTGGWYTMSTSTYNYFVSNSVTGVRKLTLPFVGGGVSPIQIIRKPVVGEALGTTLNTSRMYTKAQIRVLLADTQNDLHPERGPIGDGQDVDLVATNQSAVTGATPGGGFSVGGVMYPFAFADKTKVADGNWVKNFNDPVGTQQWPLFGDLTNVNGVQHHTWLRVEYKNAAGNWVGVTTEWLGFGFARDFEPPTTAGANPVHPKAILILQELADRNGDGTHNGSDGTLATDVFAYNYYPINFYDDREGHPRDTNLVTAANCNVNGIMNAVEIDVGNLRRWLGHAIGGAPVIAGSGNLVDFVQQNGYVLYFSDRRGMVANPVVGVTTGEYGFEDVINSGSAAGVPDGALEPPVVASPEDVNGNGAIDTWGANDVGDGFGIDLTGTNPRNPYQPVNCTTIGRANRVTGARHVLKLVDGTLGNLPTRLDNPTPPGGFTVASENPVYVQGDYNASTGAGFGDPHAAASIIADTVTVLSNSWRDSTSLNNPNNLGGRAGNNTWYRMAVAAGKTLAFPQPVWGGQDMGTDGGMHNFLRYLESWGGTLNYEGSLVSLYSSQYATGVFKCCTTVYSPPTRAYQFDQLFLQPQNLPPGTPMFQDVDNLSYHQNFTPQ